MPIKVAIFEDNKVISSVYETLLSEAEELQCVGSFTHAQDCIVELKKCNPHIVLMDIHMPNIDGIEATQIIKSIFPDIKILIQTIFEDEYKVFKAICAGASGYILKDTSPDKIINAIVDVYNGGTWFSPSIANMILNQFKNYASQSLINIDEYKLTEREAEILNYICQGKDLKNISSKLYISYETVRTHVKNIYKKLHVSSAIEAIAKIKKK